MAREIRSFDALIPAGTPVAAPVTVDMSFDPRTVTQISVRIPPGPNGNVGFQIANSGIPIIPVGQGNWLIGNDDRIEWPLTDYNDSGSWQLIGYNLGQFDHTIYVTFLLDLVQVPAPAPVAPIDAAMISSPPAEDLALPDESLPVG